MSKMEVLFKKRLFLETDIEIPNVMKDMEASIEEDEKKELNKILKKINDDEYQSWKEEYLASEYDKLKDKAFLRVKYMFAGFGSYDDVIPAEQLDSFKCWINGNGSAFFGGEEPANKEDIYRYISLNIEEE